jgi:cytidyltransferase-like protein
MSTQKQVVVCGGFDDLRARQLRFLDEASRLGELTALVWPDETVQTLTGKALKFPLAERVYFLNAVRYVSQVRAVTLPVCPDCLPQMDGLKPQIWVDEADNAREGRRKYCQQQGIEYVLLPPSQMSGFPEPPPMPSAPGCKKVIVTGCYDWFHTGHVRFTEEASAHGDLYVVLGNDANIRFLKGEGHPLFSQEERRYVVGSIKFVKQALIATGQGWIDAEPEIDVLKPDAYIVNEDGDKGGKREFCAKKGIEYLVLKRTPAPGLTRRSSTDLRGF